MSRSTYLIQHRLHVVRDLSVAGALAVGSLTSAWLVVNASWSLALMACLVALAVLAAAAKWNPGVSVGLLVLAVMNGLPGVDLEKYSVAGQFRVSDAAVALLVCALVVRIHARGASWGPWSGRLLAWGLALGAWWLIVVMRTVFLDGVPLVQAFLFGRDFLYFGILLPLLVMALRGYREIIGCVGTLFAGVMIFGLAQLAISALGASSSGWAASFVHGRTISQYEAASQLESVTRVYAQMGDALAPAVAFGLGLALMPPRRFTRLTGMIVFVVAMAALLYTFTRVLYIGIALAFVATIIVWLFGGGSVNVARRMVAVLLTILLVLIVAIDYRPLTTSIGVGQVSDRAVSTISEINQGTGTVGYRYRLARKMLGVLGSSWVGGLGFLHPASHPVPELPRRSIRNTDVGVLNSLMTMGAVGTALIYLAPVAILLGIVRRWRSPAEPEQRRSEEWWLFGATMWLIIVLVTSISLVTLFSVSGIALSAAVLACIARFLDESRSQSSESLVGLPMSR